MPRIVIELPQVAYERLTAEAIRQRRQLASEAEVRLMKSLRVPLGGTSAAQSSSSLTLVGTRSDRASRDV